MSSANLNVGGTWHSSTRPWMNVAGVWKGAQSVWVNVAGVWKQVYQNLTLSISPKPTRATHNGAATISATCTATPSTAGGTYAWSFVSGTAMTVTNGTTATPTFSAFVDISNTPVSATYQCTYTLGSNVATDQVTVNLVDTGSS